MLSAMKVLAVCALVVLLVLLVPRMGMARQASGTVNGSGNGAPKVDGIWLGALHAGSASFADKLGEHIAQRLEGAPAVALAD
jgi:hypothetical protein